MPKKTSPTVELTIGELIRRTRRNHTTEVDGRAIHMNQELAARELHVNQSTVAKWESGQRPAPEKLPLIARFVGMPLPQLLQLYHGTRDGGYAASLEEINARLTSLHAAVSQIPDLVARIATLEQRLNSQSSSPARAASRTPRRLEAASPRKSTKSRR